LKSYLLDTNICIFYMKGKFDLNQKFAGIAVDNLFISEITLAELKYGVEKSEHPAKNRQALAAFLTGVQLLPIVQALDVFAKEKARLRKAGTIIDDFDLLIGATAVAHGLVLVTNNSRHLARVESIMLEDWTQ
jgi:tRNA(fMet)-specific endonuclease VapC